MSSAHSITASVNPPRAAFLDFPLGHTAGRPNELGEQTEIMRAALGVFAHSAQGEITSLPFEWSKDHSWKEAVMAGTDSADGAEDDRVERFSDPQYQTAEDERLADPECPSCVWLGESLF